MIENLDTLFKQISLGVYVIGVSDGERQNAFTAACVMQVSFNPPLLAISINPPCLLTIYGTMWTRFASATRMAS